MTTERTGSSGRIKLLTCSSPDDRFSRCGMAVSQKLRDDVITAGTNHLSSFWSFFFALKVKVGS